MKKIVLCFLFAMSACNAGVGRLSPLSEFWKEHAQEKYSEIFKKETTLALLCAPSFPWEIKHATGYGFSIRYLIYTTHEDGKNFIHLRDIYADAEKDFSFEISERDFSKLDAFFSSAVKTLEVFDRHGTDGTSYIIRVQGAENEFAYTWSPERFTFSNDIAAVMGMLRNDCIRSIGRNFCLSPQTEEFLRIIELTPDSMRKEFIERSELIEPKGPVDPFAHC